MGKSYEVGFYEAVFIVRLRLPLSHLYRQLANYMGVSICQIAPNTWRFFICAEVLMGSAKWGMLISDP